MLIEKSTLITEATYSTDKTHRFLLTKEWDTDKPRATIIMTNPSSAGVMECDYTTLYILNNISKLGYGAIEIVNLFSKICTKLDHKCEDASYLMAENVDCIVKSADRSDLVLLAWGKLGLSYKHIGRLQENLLTHLLPNKDKLHIICSANGEEGFHPLAPQIRFEWMIKKFDTSKIPEPQTPTPLSTKSKRIGKSAKTTDRVNG